ncbi:MAG: 16S rRNA (guanine(966)-N(2))-methyltransferase RsmD [Deltaproteobacteria bacterium]|nr:16S rRNA (guanine(966)-N(2))-methyltransferase RsmD [Deltaproteobacteria bacterium]RLB91544.1 MAG: 16S rRNA (guanine(966)-N(2))-methyltransferase RsmD [Deltaproteobacteria bacterium]RLB96648.1 MAG: 16S rRNA (guanine(966)-N(2))-methyltransferase RsmD [Deltaproteobacteria bacterium]RLC11406.1 MAG: 16S rRNA (guanine(966)-N(2))-methyltransferase RsmD [Deltaproteobacteria bacterium]
MRIIAGEFKGKKLFPIRGLSIRPTTDYLRESIFNILGDRIKDRVVLDLFAGTGSLGIEALSRGAASAVFIDRYLPAVRTIERNISACSLEKRCTVLRMDILGGLNLLRSISPPFDLVFIDPPYKQALVVPTLKLLHRARCLLRGATIVVEHSVRESLAEKIAAFSLIDQRQYRKTLVSFYEYVI